MIPRVQLGEAFAQLLFDAAHGAYQLLARGHVVRAGKDRHLVQLAQYLAAQRIHLGNGLDLVAEPFHAQGFLAFVGRKDLDHIAAHAELAAGKVHVIALVLDFDQAAQNRITPHLHASGQIDLHVEIGFRCADAIDAGHRRHNDHVAPGEQGVGGGVAHAIDLFIDERILLDIGIRRRDVGLRLVVVVVADEEMHGVVGKQALELAVELVGECLVVSHDQRGALGLGDDMRHGEGLAAARDAEQHLRWIASLDASDQLFDGAWLVPRGQQIALQLKRRRHFCVSTDRARAT